MYEDWRQTYEKLLDFITQNPAVEISPDLVVIPGEAREEFYRLFDSLGREFVSGHFPAELSKGCVLSRKWQELSSSIITELNLEGIEVHLSTKWFLADPLDGLTRTLFDPLFDLLKGKDDLANFEKNTIQLVKRSFARFYREGYQRWVTIALIKALAPDKLLRVEGQDIIHDANLADSGGGLGIPSGEVPEPLETKVITFIEAPVNAFLTPRLIVHSTRLNRFVSLRPDYHESSWNSQSYSERQEWMNINEKLYKSDKHWLWPDMVIHVSEEARDLALVADYSRFARPDINIEFRENADWYEREGMAAVKRHYEAMKPGFGSIVVCCAPVPAAALEELKTTTEAGAGRDDEDDLPIYMIGSALATTVPTAGQETPAGISLLHVEYSPARLEPIFDVLALVRALREAS